MHELNFPSAARLLDALTAPDDLESAAGSVNAPIVPGYTIDRVLGAGAGGVVYRARRHGSEQPIALKVLNARFGTAQAPHRAWRELDLLSGLRLPFVPRLLDYGVIEGRLYLATEWIDGRPADEHCEQLDLGLAKRVLLLADIADAVSGLHEHGVLHRDLKPPNIIVDPSGRPTLIDLGIATLIDRDGSRTMTVDGSTVGTPAFMSPEQARGDFSTVSTRSDVYALGATAYLLLTGHTPHDQGVCVHETIRRVADEQPRDPRSLDPSLPKPLAAVLLKAVAQRPVDRYPTASAFGAELRRWLAGEPVEAGGLSAATRVARWLARHPLVGTTALAGAIVASSLVTAAVINWRFNQDPALLDLELAGRASMVLRARSGRELHRWTTVVPAPLPVDARLVALPARFGGGRIAVLGMRAWDEQLGNRITALDARQPTRRLWSVPADDDPLVMPPPISRQALDDGFVLQSIWYDTVFADEPAPQIIASFQGERYSATSIRIIGLDGRILFEVWHDGAVIDITACAQSGTLFACAINSEGTLSDRGHPGLTSLLNPIVVFAIRPQRGARHTEWIRFDGGGGTYDVLWYRALLPINPLDAFGSLRLNGSFSFRSLTTTRCDSRIRLEVGSSDFSVKGPSIGITIDAETGESVAVDGDDIYMALRAADPERWPDPSSYTLGSVPPAAPRTGP